MLKKNKFGILLNSVAFWKPKIKRRRNKIAKKSILKNYLYNLTYQILTLILPLITASYLARVLGAAGNGIYIYTMAKEK